MYHRRLMLVEGASQDRIGGRDEEHVLSGYKTSDPNAVTVIQVGRESTSGYTQYDAYLELSAQSDTLRLWAIDPNQSSFARTRHCDIEICLDEFFFHGRLSLPLGF